MPERPLEPLLLDSARVDELGGGLIAAASAAGIGVSLSTLEPLPARIVYVSDKGVEILGHAREEILSRPASDFLTPEERNARDATGGRIRAEMRPRYYETMVLRPDGTRVPIEVSFAPIGVDGRPGIISFFRDISERRAASDALARSERRFRRLIENAPDAVFLNDGRRLVFANPAAAAMLRYPDVESLLAIDPRTLFSPEDGASMAARSQEMFRTGAGLPPRDYPTRRADGTWVLAEVRSMPVEWDGRPAILGFARDLTHRREMEARLAQSERLAALGTLLAGIAHEMNNPLSYALLAIQQAKESFARLGASGENAARLGEALDGVLDGATRVAAIVAQIRASSRPDADESGPVDVRATLEASLRVTHNELHHRARLVTELGDVPPVHGNAQRLEQVFINLLVNAIQALPDGRADNRIRVTLRSTPDIVVEIADNGAGIPHDVLPRIFDPFFTTKPVGIGLGLGLSICHGIVTNHGGTIAVESTPGAGSVFRIVLPALATDAERPRAGESSARARGPTKRRRVLVVDDEPMLATMIKRILDTECDIDIALSAEAALGRINRPDAYDVILCDLMMPDMTGMDLHAEIERLYPGLERRFVFMTGGAFTTRANEFLAGLENRRLDKPFEVTTLKEAVLGDG